MLRFCEGPKPSLIESNQATPSFCVTSGRRGGHDFWRTETKVVRGINAFAEGVADNPTAIFVIKVSFENELILAKKKKTVQNYVRLLSFFKTWYSRFDF